MRISELILRQQDTCILELQTKFESILKKYDNSPSSTESSLITRWAHDGLEILKRAKQSKDNRQRSKWIRDTEALLHKIEKRRQA
jgi:hypothetical protein